MQFPLRDRADARFDEHERQANLVIVPNQNENNLRGSRRGLVFTADWEEDMKIFVIRALKGLAIQGLYLLTFASGLQATPIEPVPADKAKVPYKFAGKLFRVKDDLKLQGECSAQYVGASDVVLTAAHCVSEGNSVL